MMNLNEYDVVALTEEVQAIDKTTHNRFCYDRDKWAQFS